NFYYSNAHLTCKQRFAEGDHDKSIPRSGIHFSPQILHFIPRFPIPHPTVELGIGEIGGAPRSLCGT
ncbi:MAG: hypothetical protein OJI67_18590, partial [Prosthecobacter sp.]|nr:hypothetical protein [Prosthecobacter sp.]